MVLNTTLVALGCLRVVWGPEEVRLMWPPTRLTWGFEEVLEHAASQPSKQGHPWTPPNQIDVPWLHPYAHGRCFGRQQQGLDSPRKLHWPHSLSSWWLKSHGSLMASFLMRWRSRNDGFRSKSGFQPPRLYGSSPNIMNYSTMAVVRNKNLLVVSEGGLAEQGHFGGGVSL